MAKKLFETGCCPRFNSAPWQNKTHKWKNKLFIKNTLHCFFHIPLGMDKVMIKNMDLISKAGAKNLESICIMDDRGLFASDLYVAVDKRVPGAAMATLSGTFLSRVYEGQYNEAGKWAQDMASYVKGRGLALKKLYFSYTTCPKCAKEYGKNYVVAFAEI